MTIAEIETKIRPIDGIVSRTNNNRKTRERSLKINEIEVKPPRIARTEINIINNRMKQNLG